MQFTRRERPDRDAAEPCDEIAPSHSITSSAGTSSEVGNVIPSTFAALRLRTISIINAGHTLVIDETGVGRAVADIFDGAGLRPNRVTITSGLETTQHGGRAWHVAKSVLISGLDARLHTGELKIAAALAAL